MTELDYLITRSKAMSEQHRHMRGNLDAAVEYMERAKKDHDRHVHEKQLRAKGKWTF